MPDRHASDRSSPESPGLRPSSDASQANCAGRAAVAHDRTPMVDGICPVCGEREDAPTLAHPLIRKVVALLDSCGKDGWDSYDARGLTYGAVDAIGRTVAHALFPTVHGGLMVEWESADGQACLLVEFGPDGSVGGFYATDQHGNEVDWDDRPTGEEAAVGRLR